MAARRGVPRNLPFAFALAATAGTILSSAGLAWYGVLSTHGNMAQGRESYSYLSRLLIVTEH